MKWLVSWVGTGWKDTGACGKCRIGWEAPVSALEQDLGSQTTKEVVNEDRATEKGLRVVDESHLLQGKTQHMGTLLQNRGNLWDSLLLNVFSLVSRVDGQIASISESYSIEWQHLHSGSMS